MRRELMALHGPGHNLGDLFKRNLALAKGIHSHFIGGVENCRHGSSNCPGLARKSDCGETFEVRFLECQAAQLREIGLARSLPIRSG
jgi:hypothetical protein